MKGFFNKHDLFKILIICIVASVLFTWVFRYSEYKSNNIVTTDNAQGIQSILDGSTEGIFDVNTNAMKAINTFGPVFLVIFVVYAFYKVLGKSMRYNILINNIAKLFEHKEVLFIGISMFLYAALASVLNDYLVLLTFIPFTISILNRLKVDKLSAFAATFGGIMLGVLGTTYAASIAGVIVKTVNMSVNYTSDILATLLITVIAYVSLLTLVYIRIKDNNKYEVVEDIFIEEKTSKRKHLSVVLLAITLSIFALIIICAFMPWNVWGITLFDDIYNSITQATLFNQNYPIVFLGAQYFAPFGSWTLYVLSGFFILMTFIIKFVGRISFDDVIEGIIEGVKLSIKPVVIFALICVVLATNIVYIVLPQLLETISKLISLDVLKPINWFVTGFVSALFYPDFDYLTQIVGPFFGKITEAGPIFVGLKAINGFAAFIAPTSILLMLGLSSLDIKFKDYLKFIWKFLIALLVIILAVLYILLYI